jgi:hypothetical protein
MKFVETFNFLLNSKLIDATGKLRRDLRLPWLRRSGNIDLATAIRLFFGPVFGLLGHPSFSGL